MDSDAPGLSHGFCMPGRSRWPPDMWADPADFADRRRAVCLCRACPELAPCRDWVLSLPSRDQPPGIVAGMTESQRGGRRRALLNAKRERRRERDAMAGLATATATAAEPGPAVTAFAALATATGTVPAAGTRIGRRLPPPRITPGRLRTTAALLADPLRSNRVIATAAQTDHMLAGRVRHELEAEGRITRFRAGSAPVSPRRTPKLNRVKELLLEDPRRPNRKVAADAGVSHPVVIRARHELEDAGLIEVYRAPPVWDGLPG